jgi:hypothetical protein
MIPLPKIVIDLDQMEQSATAKTLCLGYRLVNGILDDSEETEVTRKVLVKCYSAHLQYLSADANRVYGKLASGSFGKRFFDTLLTCRMLKAFILKSDSSGAILKLLDLPKLNCIHLLGLTFEDSADLPQFISKLAKNQSIESLTLVQDEYDRSVVKSFEELFQQKTNWINCPGISTLLYQ